jgi:hypothetical protein
MPTLMCGARLELPGDVYVYCRQAAGHEGKHTGGRSGKRYRWAAMHARAARLVPWEGL